MKTSKGKDLSVFVRFGNLDHNAIQKGFGKDSFHAPPARRGFYAMPKIAQERFLIGSLPDTQPQHFPKNPKLFEKYPTYWVGTDPEKDEIYRKFKEKVAKSYEKIRREFVKRDGFIWHHLEDSVKNHQVVDRHGCWVKTSVKDWAKAFGKDVVKLRAQGGGFEGEGKGGQATRFFGGYSKDHYEVFIDEKI